MFDRNAGGMPEKTDGGEGPMAMDAEMLDLISAFKDAAAVLNDSDDMDDMEHAEKLLNLPTVDEDSDKDDMAGANEHGVAAGHLAAILDRLVEAILTSSGEEREYFISLEKSYRSLYRDTLEQRSAEERRVLSARVSGIIETAESVVDYMRMEYDRRVARGEDVSFEDFLRGVKDYEAEVDERIRGILQA